MAASHNARLVYDELANPQEMSADCRALERNLRLPALERAARAAVSAAPSLRYEDYPREVVKRQVRVSDAAARLASALYLPAD